MPRCGRARRTCASCSSCCTLLETLPVRVFWKDRGSNYLGSNHFFALDAGLTDSDQLVGKSDFDFPGSSKRLPIEPTIRRSWKVESRLELKSG